MVEGSASLAGIAPEPARCPVPPNSSVSAETYGASRFWGHPTGLRRTGSDVAEIKDLYGHTDPETTTIYAPPQLEKHVEAIERLRRAEATSEAISCGNGWQSRLAEKQRDCKLLILKDAPVAARGRAADSPRRAAAPAVLIAPSFATVGNDGGRASRGRRGTPARR